jgi:hypothetical protein
LPPEDYPSDDRFVEPALNSNTPHLLCIMQVDY